MKGLHIVHDTSIQDGDLDLGVSISFATKRVAEGEMFIVKGVFSPAALKEMVLEVFNSYKDVEPKVLDYHWGIENYWRLDNNPPKSSRPKVQSLYFTFFWNKEFPRVMEIGKMLGRLRNKIAGLDIDYGFREDDEHLAYSLFQHYPLGGGFICEHGDLLEPQKCVTVLNLPGDFDKGGLYVNPAGEKIPLEPLMEAGDLFIFRPNVLHGVDPIDPDKPLDFQSPNGRWRMACALVQNKQRIY